MTGQRWLPPDHPEARLAIAVIIITAQLQPQTKNATEIAIAIMSVNDVSWSLGYKFTDFADGAT